MLVEHLDEDTETLHTQRFVLEELGFMAGLINSEFTSNIIT